MTRPAIGDATLRRQPLGWLRPKAGSAGARSAIANPFRSLLNLIHERQAHKRLSEIVAQTRAWT
jgi:hypothetical protein